MTNEELNRRLRFCAERGLPYCDKLWRALAEAWERGMRDHFETGPSAQNPFLEKR